MARLALTTGINNVGGPYPATLPVAANSLDVVFQAASVQADGIMFAATGRDILLVRNENAGAQTFTIGSTPDARGRSGDIAAYSLSPAEVAAFDFRNALEGWRQADGNIYVNASNIQVTFAVLRLAS